MTDRITMNQSDIARVFNVDRTTIRAWQKKGMPYFDNGKGKPSTFDFWIAMRWVLGSNLEKEFDIPVRTPLEAICYSYALQRNTYGRLWTPESVLKEIQMFFDVDINAFYKVYGYCHGVLESKEIHDSLPLENRTRNIYSY